MASPFFTPIFSPPPSPDLLIRNPPPSEFHPQTRFNKLSSSESFNPFFFHLPRCDALSLGALTSVQTCIRMSLWKVFSIFFFGLLFRLLLRN